MSAGARHGFAIVAFALVSVAILAACSSPGPTPPAVEPPSVTPLAAPPDSPAGSGVQATIETAKGAIAIELFDRSSPVAAANFVALAESGWYDGVVFHRLVPGFVIQGGDGVYGRAGSIDEDLIGSGGPGYTIPDEEVVGDYVRGTVAMARSMRPNSQGSQFFIVLDDGASAILDDRRTYAIFGRVTSGMDAVDAIAAMPNFGEPDNRALEPVAMERVTVARP